MPNDKATIYEKLLKIRKAMPYFKKDAPGYNYRYVSGCSVLETFRKIADEVGVLLFTSITGSKITETKIINDRNQEKIGRIVDLDLLFTFIDVENPESKIEIPFKAYGEQQDCSKAFGSALTYAERYFILKFNNVPTDTDDPDTKGTGNETGQEQGAGDPKIFEGDKLAATHYINEKERSKWERSKDDPESINKGFTYISEKCRIGADLELDFYRKFMTDKKKERTKKEAQAEAANKIEKEFTPLTLKEIETKYGENQ